MTDIEFLDLIRQTQSPGDFKIETESNGDCRITIFRSVIVMPTLQECVDALIREYAEASLRDQIKRNKANA